MSTSRLKLKRMINQERIKIGDFICVSEPSAYCYNLDWDSAQAIGRVVAVKDFNSYYPKYSIEFPKRLKIIATTEYWPEEVRKASAYEGMMAFWDPEEENIAFDIKQSAFPFKPPKRLIEQHVLGGTKQKRPDLIICDDVASTDTPEQIAKMKAFVEDKRITTAREKADQRNVTAEDL